MNFITFEKITKQFNNDTEADTYLNELINSLSPEYTVTRSFVDDDSTDEDFVAVIILQNKKLEMKIIVTHNLQKLNDIY